MSTTSLLPDNRTTLETALEKTLSDHLLNIESPYPDLWSPTDVSVDMLPYLAHAKGVTDWGDDTDAAKRQTVQDIWPMQRQAGTRLAVKRAVDALGFDADVVRGDQPYHLKIDLWRGDVGTVEPDLMARVHRRIEGVKSERDALAVTLNATSDGVINIGLSSSATITTTSVADSDDKTDIGVGIGLAAAALLNVSSASAIEQLKTQCDLSVALAGQVQLCVVSAPDVEPVSADMSVGVALASSSQLQLTVTECY